ncbi:hypothetical protein HDU79_010719, partial [Rhizoclosmatium sp. JEL0117]
MAADRKYLSRIYSLVDYDIGNHTLLPGMTLQDGCLNEFMSVERKFLNTSAACGDGSLGSRFRRYFKSPGYPNVKIIDEANVYLSFTVSDGSRRAQKEVLFHYFDKSFIPTTTIVSTAISTTLSSSTVSTLPSSTALSSTAPSSTLTSTTLIAPVSTVTSATASISSSISASTSTVTASIGTATATASVKGSAAITTPTTVAFNALATTVVAPTTVPTGYVAPTGYSGPTAYGVPAAANNIYK